MLFLFYQEKDFVLVMSSISRIQMALSNIQNNGEISIVIQFEQIWKERDE